MMHNDNPTQEEPVQQLLTNNIDIEQPIISQPASQKDWWGISQIVLCTIQLLWCVTTVVLYLCFYWDAMHSAGQYVGAVLLVTAILLGIIVIVGVNNVVGTLSVFVRNKSRVASGMLSIVFVIVLILYFTGGVFAFYSLKEGLVTQDTILFSIILFYFPLTVDMLQIVVGIIRTALLLRA
jgi:uncharacterized membrane protein